MTSLVKKYLKFSRELQTLGEAGIVKIIIGGKIGDYGAPCMFVGYFHNHNKNCYLMKNPKTMQVTETKDLIFL